MLNSRKKLVELRDGQKARISDQGYLSKRGISGRQSSAIETDRPGLYEKWKIVLDRMQDRQIVPWKGPEEGASRIGRASGHANYPSQTQKTQSRADKSGGWKTVRPEEPRS